MSGVCGKWVNEFKDASHVCFEGSLDDPSFRRIAIQKIEKIEGKVIISEISGRLEIRKWRGRQRVMATYRCPLFGLQKRWGYPFKDDSTPIIHQTVMNIKEGDI